MLRLGLFAIPSFAILLGLLIWITLALAVESSMSTVSKYLLVVQHILNKPIVPIQVSIWHFRTSLSMAVWQTQCAYIPREKAAKNIDSPNSHCLEFHDSYTRSRLAKQDMAQQLSVYTRIFFVRIPSLAKLATYDSNQQASKKQNHTFFSITTSDIYLSLNRTDLSRISVLYG